MIRFFQPSVGVVLFADMLPHRPVGPSVIELMSIISISVMVLITPGAMFVYMDKIALMAGQFQ